ncbi:conserved Plasmodium protein, unknown function [Plasmodium relictum]|uniref:Uncharacterized protein n=1 Tax=Plasmodium relictum TaxID=85471 RepID=A0A1J1HAE5_PLARL|nr:conserved Plasmodium protein, unknown function [Plasmodium relictum]CRH02433.1 conserved Plasmodium protein, unknown function [Plasmodium relictum]
MCMKTTFLQEKGKNILKMQEKYKKNNKEVNEDKKNVFNNEFNKSNSEKINHNSYEYCDISKKYAYHYTDIIETSEKNILYTEKSIDNEKNNLSTYSEESLNRLKHKAVNEYSSDQNDISYNEKKISSKKKEIILKKNHSSPCSYREKISYIACVENKSDNNENFKIVNKEKNNNIKSTNSINEELFNKENSNNITMKSEDIEKKLSFSESFNNSKDNEMKESINKYDINIKNEKNRHNGENIKINENTQNDIYIKMDKTEQNDTLIKKNKNIKNMPNKKYESTQNNIVKNYSKIESKENIKKDQIIEKANSARNDYLYNLNLKNKKKKKNEDYSGNSSEIYVNNNLDVKNNYDIEKNTKNTQKENITECFKSYKINNELNTLNLREKNSEIKESSEKFSKNAIKQKIYNSNKLKYNKKKLLQSNIINTNDLQKKSSEEIMIQKIFINESDTNDKVQKKIHRIEHNMEEKENETANNDMKVKRKIISEKENEKLDFEIELSSVDSSILTNDFTKEEREKNVKNLIHENKYRIDENHGIIISKSEKDDIEKFNFICNFSNENDSNTQKRELNKSVVLINEELKNDDSIKSKELKKVNSNYSKELIDIKIYDDSEIDEIKNNDLELFWNNKEVSTILKESQYDSHKNSDEGNEETVIWNSENYNTIEISNNKFSSYKKKKKTQVKRCKSDSTNYKRKNDITFERKNTINDIIERGNLKKSENNNRNIYIPNVNNNKNCVNKEKKEDINIESKLDVIKSKLALNNNIDIDSVNFESFDIYQIDFEKLGLNVDNLDKEEKYILLLYISEKKLEFVWNEREAFKRAHSNIKNFQANQNKIREMKNAYSKNSLFNENKENDNFNNKKGDKNNNRPTDTQYFKINSVFNKKEFGNEKNKKIYELLSENTNENEFIKFSTSQSSDISMYKSTNKQKNYHASRTNHLLNENSSSEIRNNDNLPKYGFFFEFYSKLLKKYKVLNKTDNASNVKVLLEKFLKCCIYLFFQDEYIDNFLKYYEDIKKAETKEEIIFKNFLCAEYMCNKFQDIYNTEERTNNEEIMLLSSYYSEMREIVSKFILNDNLVSKIRQIQIINKILKDEVRTYAIKVANHDIYFDVEPHFIEESEKVIVGKDIGFFNISILDKNYKYNYYVYEKETKLEHKNSFWRYFYGYFNDLFYWYQDKNENGFPEHEKGESGNKDISSSKRFSRNFMKLNGSKEENNDSSEHNMENKNFLKKDEENKSTLKMEKKENNSLNNEESKENLKKEEREDNLLNNNESNKGNLKKYEKKDNTLNNDDENRDTLKNEEKKDNYINNDEKNKESSINEMKEINLLKIEENSENIHLESKGESINLIENKKILSNISKDKTILSNSTKIEDCLMESNLSSIDNFISENSSDIKLDDICYSDNKNMNNFLHKEVKCNEDNNNTFNKNYIDTSKNNSSIKNDDNKKFLNNFDCKNKNSLNGNHNITEKKNIKHKNMLAHLVAFQYRGSLPKDEINDFNKINKNKNIIGSYFSSYLNDSLVAIHIKNESIQNFLNTHFIIERCRKYNKDIKKSYVHILNSNTKQYLAVNLENKKIMFTNNYNDISYIDEFDVENKISTYFELQSISDMMKNILIEDIIQSVANIMLN